MTEPRTIAGALAADDRFTLMAGAIRATGFDSVLAGKGPFTLCAPTDTAFRNLPPAAFAALMKDPRGELTRVLRYYIINGSLPSETLKKQKSAETRLGITVEIVEKEGTVVYGGAPVVIPDIACSNGTLHGLGAVVIPP